MPARTYPTVRTLPTRPDVIQLKRQAKELLKAFLADDADAVEAVTVHYRGARADTFALHDAQLVLARSYGFPSWSKLKAYVDGVTIRRLVDAVREGDLATARAMLRSRPELANFSLSADDEHRPLHYAVIARNAEMTRLLMEHGADPRIGIWPHRDATCALALARERGYSEISTILLEQKAGAEPKQDDEADPVESTDPDASLKRARSAIKANDAEVLRVLNREGALSNQPGLVMYAVESNRPDMLRLLLELGLDPDEPGRVGGLDESVLTWGDPLRESVSAGRFAMAECLLEHGANANTNVYAGTSALFEAHQRKDTAMVALLDEHGARLDPWAVALLGLTDQAARLLATAKADPSGPDASKVAAELLWAAIEKPAPEIVRLALEHIDWPKDDGRWYGILQNGFYASAEHKRAGHLDALRMVLDRADANVRDNRGSTLMHYIAAAHGQRTARDRMTYASMLLDAGARLDVRDDVLRSTPLGWACRWGRVELVRLLLERGADPIEADAEPWATPMAWAKTMKRADVQAVLRACAAS